MNSMKNNWKIELKKESNVCGDNYRPFYCLTGHTQPGVIDNGKAGPEITLISPLP